MKPLTIVAVAIVGAIGLVLGLNFAAVPETQTQYSTVADITPTVEHQDVTGWAALSPASNWTGFYPYSSYTFTEMEDGSYSRYPIQPTADPVTTHPSVKDNPTRTFSANSTTVYVFDYGDGYLSTGTLHEVSGGYSRVTKTADVALKRITNFATFDSNSKILLQFDTPCLIPLKVIGIYSASGVQIRLYACGSFGTGLQKLAQSMTYTPGTGGQPSVYSGMDADGNPVWSLTDENEFKVYAIWGGKYVDGYPLAGTERGFSNVVIGNGPDPQSCTVTVSEFNPQDPVKYADIRDGITILPTADVDESPTYWSNGYKNGIVTVLIRTDSYLTVKTGTDPYDGWIAVLRSDDAGNSVLKLGHFLDPVKTIAIPRMYPAFTLTIDTIAGELRVTPIMQFVDYQTWTPGPATYTVPFKTDPITTMAFYSGLISDDSNDIATIGIVYTEVATDPNGLLWLNPQIKPPAWFPSMTQSAYSVYFRSGVTYGDTITINGQTFPVSSNGYVTVDGEQWPIAGLSIDYSGGQVVLQLPKGSKTVSYSLGNQVDASISGTGIWYAQIDLRSISSETVDVLKYDPDGWASHADIKAVLVIFMALVTGLSMWAMRSREMSSGGIATVIIALAIAWIVLGVFA